MGTPIKDIVKFEAGQIFVSDTQGLEAIQIMAVVDGFIMARHKLGFPFVYTARMMKEIFFSYHLK